MDKLLKELNLNESELIAALEAARIALSDEDVFTKLSENLDMSGEALSDLLKKIERFMGME